MAEPNGSGEGNSRCAACGRLFHCGMKDEQPCWCATDFPPVLTGEPQAACLCPECLRARIAAHGRSTT